MNENESKKILIFGDGGLSNGFIDNFLIDPMFLKFLHFKKARF